MELLYDVCSYSTVDYCWAERDDFSRKMGKPYFKAALLLLIFPIAFLLSHFFSSKSEMKGRAGTYIVIRPVTVNSFELGIKNWSQRSPRRHGGQDDRNACPTQAGRNLSIG